MHRRSFASPPSAGSTGNDCGQRPSCPPMFHPTRQSSALPTPWRFSSRAMSPTRSNVTATRLIAGSFSGTCSGTGLGTGFHAWRMRISGAATAYLRASLPFTRSLNGFTAPRSSWYARYARAMPL